MSSVNPPDGGGGKIARGAVDFVARRFDANIRIDPDDAAGEGTLARFERDLGHKDSRTLQRFGA